MTDSLKEIYGKSQEIAINNQSSGIFNACIGVDQCFGPIFGAFSFKRVGFRWTSDILAISCLAFALLYFVVTNGYKAIKASSGHA